MPSTPELDRILADLRVAVGASCSGISDAELLAELAAVEAVGRVVDAARVRLSGEVGARSRRELGDDGLSRSQNFTSPTKLVSEVAGVSEAEAARRLALGDRLRGAVQLGGVEGPVPFPRLSEALQAGVLAVEAAGVIVKRCAELAARGLSGVVVAEAEQTLVDQTVHGHLTPDDTARLAIRLRELLDPDGAEPRDEVQQQQRSLTFAVSSSDGMVRGKFALTPEQAGVWVGSIQALQSPRVAGPRFLSEDEAGADVITADTRTQAQKNVDTVTELITRAASAPEMPHLNGSVTTVNVHATLTDLEAGRGVGWIDGVEEPVAISTIEQLRCHAPTATTLFGDHGEVLHHGKARRLFSPAQNRALAARDGGCVWRGCQRPPSWCETHHVVPWGSDDHPPGRTDIDNGVLLCHLHHSRVHKSDWKLVMRDGVPHLVPPRYLDPEQCPIATTRRRTALPPELPTAA
ncbi:DUF222 domain-containing protein [Herbiconiux sp. P16]|uniref:HNH endonuclease signature motif containing protein n=1 Tax=Herbiconiux wuyangfengii TaxID=3342794 RepID=UPI0035BA32BB